MILCYTYYIILSSSFWGKCHGILTGMTVKMYMDNYPKIAELLTGIYIWKIYGNIWYINGYVVSIWGFPGQWISLSFPDDLWKHPFTLAAPTKQGPWALLRRQETGQSSASGNQRSLVCRTGQISKIGWWFGTFLIFPYMGNSNPNWLSHIFQRGRSTTNQIMGLSENEVYPDPEKNCLGSMMMNQWI